MKHTTLKPHATHRRGERGAALVMTLLISTLLLAAGGSLIFSTMMSATGAIDSTPEQQAYYAAESGLQGALNVLRGNVAASPALSAGQTMTFTRALSLADSNDTLGGDTSADSRLSRWLQYNYPTNAGLAARDRIVLGNAATYSPLTGMAYSVVITDPYDQDRMVFSTTGTFTAPAVSGGVTASTTNGNTRLTVTDATGANRVTLEFVPKNETTLASAYTATASDLGIVSVVEAVGATDFDDTDFFTSSPKIRIRVNQTAPWSSTDFLEGTLTGSISRNAAGALTNSIVIRYPTQPSVLTDGGTYTLTAAASGNPAVYRVNLNGTDTTLAATVTVAEPKYVLVTSTGYGPRGARKQLQMMVSRSAIMFDPPAAITAAGGAGITIDLGSSNASDFDGLGSRPAVAVSTTNYGAATTAVTNSNTQGSGTQVTPATVGQLGDDVRQPSFLDTPDAARAFLETLRKQAMPTGEDTSADRYFTTMPAPAQMGATGTPKLTFIDNYGGAAVTLGTGNQGSGLLIVTGDLDTDGGTDFSGIILVLGSGRMTRSGGGGGTIGGSIIVACFNPNNPDADTFCNPTYDASGGGNSTTEFDPDAIANALKFAGRGVLGVVEN
ncbi:MAG TPA: pilus assembly PilX N-terminal domain-containing protein [Pyrinomonadaceae bacterium]